MRLWSHDRSSLEGAVQTSKGGDKRNDLTPSPDLAKLTPKWHMNYS